jgi:nicotinamide-nucleotide amidase
MRLEAEIVATGDELMTGAIQDTNTAFTCRRLREHGVYVTRSTMVGDPQPEIERALKEATGRAKVVIVSGGLGPTEDDRTAAAAAAVAGVPLERNDAALAHIQELFRRFGRPMTPNNAKQADFPKGADILDNPIGTAPGFAVRYGESTAYFLPGVPREHQKMLDEQVLPRVDRIRDQLGDTRALGIRVVKTFGYGESQLEHELRGVDFGPEITVGYRAKFPEIHLRLYAEADGAKAITQALDGAESKIREKLGVRVFALDEQTMASVLGGLLEKKDWKIALAESCTGGMIGSLLTEIPGSSNWFDRGWISYSNESKQAELGVPADVLKEHGAVSEPCVRAMAAGARDRSGCPIAISVTGIAGPGGGTPEKPVGTVWIACATAQGIDSRKLSFSWGDRERIRLASAFSAMDLARRTLLDAER